MEKEALLYKYFLEELSAEERMQFNGLLTSDKEFREQFEFEKELQTVIKQKERLAIKEKLLAIEEKLAPPKQQFLWWKSLGIAASLMLALGLGWYFLNGKTNMEELYAANYKTYPNTVFPIIRNGTEDSPERKAFVAYEADNHNLAIKRFSALKKDTPADYIDFYLGQSYLQTQNTEMAIPIFKVIYSSGGQFSAEALWYLALAQLLNKDTQKAKTNLEILIAGEAYNTNAAKELLQQLK